MTDRHKSEEGRVVGKSEDNTMEKREIERVKGI